MNFYSFPLHYISQPQFVLDVNHKTVTDKKTYSRSKNDTPLKHRVQKHHMDVMQRKARDQITNLRDLTYICQDEPTLSKLNTTLSDAIFNLSRHCPRDHTGGLILLQETTKSKSDFDITSERKEYTVLMSVNLAISLSVLHPF